MMMIALLVLGLLGGKTSVGLQVNSSRTTSPDMLPHSPPKCRDRGAWLPVDNYHRRSCAMCYGYLFQNKKPLGIIPPAFEFLMERPGANATVVLTLPIPADIKNVTAKGLICSTLSHDECVRWTECCDSARDCCEGQLSTPAAAEPRTCSRTWDGYGCWKDTPAGNDVTIQCPSYLTDYSLSRGEAVKTCTVNGTWFMQVHGPNSYEWTDYRPCLDRNAYLVGVYIVLSFNIASLVLLVPAIIVFCVFRDLYKQHRVKLHINFFISLTLNSITGILWYMLVHKDLLTNPNHAEIIMNVNPVWCRILSCLKIYLTSTNYFWMFCEGYYLHRLITKAFEPPKTLIWLYLLGWAVPAFPSMVYSIIRAVHANSSCWARSYGAYEWFYYAPNLVCLMVNLVFLCNILRILLFQLHSHPHEPSNFRRGLKAAFMLIPLFGLQLFLTIYRPSPGATGERQFEYITFFINSSQGIFVALIFCFFNSEVIAQMRNFCPDWCCYGRKKHIRRQHSMVTQVTIADDRRSHSPTNSDRSRNSANYSPKHTRTMLANGMEVDVCEMANLSANSSQLSLHKGNGALEKTRKGYTQVPTLAGINSSS